MSRAWIIGKRLCVAEGVGDLDKENSAGIKGVGGDTAQRVGDALDVAVDVEKTGAVLNSTA